MSGMCLNDKCFEIVWNRFKKEIKEKSKNYYTNSDKSWVDAGYDIALDDIIDMIDKIEKEEFGAIFAEEKKGK